METLIDQFREDLKIQGRSKDTCEQYPQILKRFEAFVGGDLLSVDKARLINYVKHLKDNSLASRQRYFSAIGSFYDFMVELDLMESNPVTPSFKKRYLRGYKSDSNRQRRKCPTIEEARRLVSGIITIRERAAIVALLKTGLRCSELISLDVDDLDLPNLTLHLKPTNKRSNLTIFFDEETAQLLRKWLARREKMARSQALFLNAQGDRYSRDSFEIMFVKYSTAAGLHNAASNRLEDRCTPHSCRHFFTSQLLERGMRREYVQTLRGDVVKDAVDIYHHISMEKLKESYLAHMPPLFAEGD